MGGGAWPFLVRGLICLVDSDNERDLNLLNSRRSRLLGECSGPCGFRAAWPLLDLGRSIVDGFLEGLLRLTERRFEAITGL